MDEIPLAYVRVGENRYRESRGFYYEDFIPGDVIEHRPGRTVTQLDNAWFSLLTMNQHPVHVDVEYGKRTEFGGRALFNSSLTLAIVGSMSVTTVSHRAVCNLGWDEVRLPHPVFEGDTLYAETLVLDKRESASRPTQGIVRVRTTGKNQAGIVVITFIRTALLPKRGHSLEDKIGY